MFYFTRNHGLTVKQFLEYTLSLCLNKTKLPYWQTPQKPSVAQEPET